METGRRARPSQIRDGELAKRAKGAEAPSGHERGPARCELGTSRLGPGRVLLDDRAGPYTDRFTCRGCRRTLQVPRPIGSLSSPTETRSGAQEVPDPVGTRQRRRDRGGGAWASVETPPTRPKGTAHAATSHVSDDLAKLITYQVNDCASLEVTNTSRETVFLRLRANGALGEARVPAGMTMTEPLQSGPFGVGALDERARAIGGTCPVVLYVLMKAAPPVPLQARRSNTPSCTFLRDSRSHFEDANPRPTTAAEQDEHNATDERMAGEGC